MLIDTHCHFPDERYGKSEDEIVKEALDAGVAKLINIGTNLKDNEKVLATLQKFPNVYAALGIYPHEELKNDLADLMIRLEKQLDSSEKVVVEKFLLGARPSFPAATTPRPSPPKSKRAKIC